MDNAAMQKVFGLLGKSALALLVFNEVRGVILAVPVFWTMYETGGTLMAIWLGICSLAGIALSVLVPIVGMKLLRTHSPPREIFRVEKISA
jgi:hypothetical protein